ncbi:helix-turn-helix domain-containing protein [Siminovitchia sp. 179-K 8D1 HS]|uniref:PucR family transcriptional regulator n=1 Tax=Siminovitchia sp. 179-K 8D1 HS TaxID=3142385 RepID=UPI00399F55A7
MLFDELGLLPRIFGSSHINEVADMAGNVLNGLKEYDAKYDSELIKTLYCYFESQGNLHETARMIGVSVGAVRYRLKRIYEISGMDVTDSKHFYEAYVAMQLLLFLGLITMD